MKIVFFRFVLFSLASFALATGEAELPEGAVLLKEASDTVELKDAFNADAVDQVPQEDLEGEENSPLIRSRNLADWSLSATASSPTDVMISWESWEGWEFTICWRPGTGWWVRRNTCRGPPNESQVTAGVDTAWNNGIASTNIVGLTCGTTYTIKVKRGFGSDITTVTTQPCPPTCSNPCPIGFYDGANCFVCDIPSGSSPFYLSSTGFHYYTAVSGSNPCPCPNSWYDSANCVVPFPSGASVFIWSGNYYYQDCP